MMLQLEVLISYIAGPIFHLRCNERGSAYGSYMPKMVLEVAVTHLKPWGGGGGGGLYLVVTDVVPVSGNADKKKLTYFYKNDLGIASYSCP